MIIGQRALEMTAMTLSTEASSSIFELPNFFTRIKRRHDYIYFPNSDLAGAISCPVVEEYFLSHVISASQLTRLHSRHYGYIKHFAAYHVPDHAI